MVRTHQYDKVSDLGIFFFLSFLWMHFVSDYYALNYQRISHMWSDFIAALQAINYYETALNTSIKDSVCLELAELLLKLKQPERAEKIIQKALDHEDSNAFI